MASLPPRRIPRAAAVTLLALLVLGSGAGFAAGSGDRAPETFHVPAPHAGDRWVYEDGDGGEVHHAWHPSEAWRDGNGTWHAVDRLTRSFSAGVEQGSHWMVAADGAVLAQRTDGLLRMSASVESLPVVGVERVEMEGLLTVERYGPADLPCGVRSPFQAGPVDLGAPLALESCGDAPFHVVGAEEVAGHRALRLHAEDGEHARDLWFVPHLPVPVRIAWTDADGATNGRELVGFERGDAPLGQTIDLPETEPLPRLEVAARPPWGIDDDGVDVPFRLSEAWAAARDDPLSTEFRDRLARDPDLHAVAAHATAEQGDDQSRVTWVIDLHGDEGGARLTVTRTFHEGALGLLRPHEDAIEWSPHGPTSGAALEQVPTAASLMRRWDSLHPDAPANAYALDLSCATDCGDHGALEVGHATVRRTGGSLLPEDVEYRTLDRRLVLDGAGRPLWTQAAEGTSSYQRGQVGTDLHVPPPERDPDPDALAASTWGLPATPARAGVAGAALVAGLLYWLWPLLKSGGAVGLFSRLRREELEEHPARAAILDAVQGQPGIHHSALVRLLGRGKGAVDHHVRKLLDARLLVVRKSAGRTCYFPRGALDGETMAALPHLSPAGARVLSWVVANPGRSASEAARSVGVTKPTMSHHVRRLREAGLLFSEDGGALRATPVGGRAARVATA